MECYQTMGKEVVRGKAHIADAVSEQAAEEIAAALNATILRGDGKRPWPSHLTQFLFGDPVQCNGKSPYRFPGRIVGWYERKDGTIGHCISREGDEGNVEIFPAARLQMRSMGGPDRLIADDPHYKDQQERDPGEWDRQMREPYPSGENKHRNPENRFDELVQATLMGCDQTEKGTVGIGCPPEGSEKKTDNLEFAHFSLNADEAQSLDHAYRIGGEVVSGWHRAYSVLHGISYDIDSVDELLLRKNMAGDVVGASFTALRFMRN